MKRSVFRHWRDRAAGLCRPPKRPGPPATLGGEMLSSAATGGAACLFFAVVAGGGAVVLAWSGLAGIVAGCVVGLVFWVGSDVHAESPVLPAQPSRWVVIRSPALSLADPPKEHSGGRKAGKGTGWWRRH
jgi:hypothetical protein